MDGQNFQNGNEQSNGQGFDQNVAPVATPAANSYQDNTGAYSDPIYSNGTTYTDNAANNTYTNNAYQNNTYTDNTAVYGEPVTEEQKTPGTAIASLILGICGILLDCCCGVGLVFGIIGLILGIVGNKNRKSGVGTAGIVCSVIAIVVGVLTVIYFFVLGGMAYMDEMM
ncbi:MAG: DUF4190 domain-containing protein [Lachnospiraceae bacterium]|nr:DUF4190 domain-containing protein [Lachnospiraceae bacterium]